MDQPGLFFVYIGSFQQQFYRKIVDLGGIRARIVGIEGENADHFNTTTTAPINVFSDVKGVQMSEEKNFSLKRSKSFFAVSSSWTFEKLKDMKYQSGHHAV